MNVIECDGCGKRVPVDHRVPDGWADGTRIPRGTLSSVRFDLCPDCVTAAFQHLASRRPIFAKEDNRA